MPNYFFLLIRLMIGGLLACFIAYKILITPDNPLTQLFRSEISITNANVITGPYPVEKDIAQLSANHVETIVSLLDPAIPYEKHLLEEEKQLAQRYHIQFLNFPMASILGQKMGDYYDNNAQAAANAIMASRGKVYLHCYLGIHRLGNVQKLLQHNQKIVIASYTLRQGERTPEAMQLDAAEKSYQEKNYQQAKQQLATLKTLSPNAQILKGWVDYKLNDCVAARKSFQAALNTAIANEALVGLGYCDLHEHKLDSAATFFTQVLSKEPQNTEALKGMELVRAQQKE